MSRLSLSAVLTAFAGNIRRCWQLFGFLIFFGGTFLLNSGGAYATPTTPGIPLSTNWTGDHYVTGDFTLTTSGSTDTKSTISYYRLCRSFDSDGEWRGCESWVGQTSGPTDMSLLVTGNNKPSLGKMRWYYWYAYNAAGQLTGSAGQYVNDLTRDTVAPGSPGIALTSWTRDHYVTGDFTLTSTGATDAESGVNHYGLCRSLESSGEWRGCETWVTQSAGTSVTLTGANRPSSGKMMWYYWYAWDNNNHMSGSSTAQYIRVDSAAPSFNAVTFSGCNYENGNDCWVKNGQTLTVNVQHTENPSTMNVGTNTQYLEFTKDNLSPGSDSISTGNIRSSAQPYGTANGTNYSAFQDEGLGKNMMLTDDPHLDIQSVQCIQSGDCSSVAKGAWKVVAGSGSNANYGVTVNTSDGLNQSTGFTSSGKWVKVDNSVPTNTSLTISNSNWQFGNNTAYTITAVVRDGESGLNGGNAGIAVLINLQGTNAANQRGYFVWHTSALPGPLDQMDCTGGGKVSKMDSTSSNPATVLLTGCTTTLNGNERTVTFTVVPQSTFGTFDHMNDIALMAVDSAGNASNWQNYDLNFSSYHVVTTVNCNFDPTSFSNKTKGTLVSWVATCGASFANFLLAAEIPTDSTLAALQAANVNTLISSLAILHTDPVAVGSLNGQGSFLPALQQKIQAYVCNAKLNSYNRTQIITDYHLNGAPLNISPTLSCS